MQRPLAMPDRGRCRDCRGRAAHRETVVEAPPWKDAAPSDLAADVPPDAPDAAPFESTAEAEAASPAFEEDRPSDDQPSDDRPFGSPGI